MSINSDLIFDFYRGLSYKELELKYNKTHEEIADIVIAKIELDAELEIKHKLK